RAAARLLVHPHQLLITILVGNMVVNVATASLLASLFTVHLELGGSGVAGSIFVTTFLLLVFGEVTPKTFAVRNAALVARVAAVPLAAFGRAIAPIRLVLRTVTNGILFVLTRGRVHGERQLTRREFEAAFEVGQAEGVIDEHEREMVAHIFDFRRIAARELMVPRTEMVCVAETDSVAKAAALSGRSGHARLPVHSGHLDSIWGVFDARDLPAWRDHDVRSLSLRDFVAYRDALDEAPRRPLVRPAFLVPEFRHAGDLLQDMRRTGAHMAILVDEYGGTAGLASLRQLVDELVGGVLATGRSGEALYTPTADGLHVLGEARVRDANDDLGLGLPVGVADTVGGYVMSLFGDLPHEGEEVSDGRLHYTVLRLDGRRIDAVGIRDPLGRTLHGTQSHPPEPSHDSDAAPGEGAPWPSP
ncbi:HlyC/CorC family transporter, partial [bacterium]|nr:HlyC/CorC family transporter [bacterium]